MKSENNVPTKNDSGKYLYPIKISRATARMVEVKKYYNKDIGVDILRNHIGLDGSETHIVMFD